MRRHIALAARATIGAWPGIDAAGVEGRAAPRGRVPQPDAWARRRSRGPASMYMVATDVGARLEDALEVVEVGPVGHVRDAVGLEGEQRLDVVGGGHADRVDAAQLADVAPDLVGRVGVAARPGRAPGGRPCPARPRCRSCRWSTARPGDAGSSAPASRATRVEVFCSSVHTPTASSRGSAKQVAETQASSGVGVADGPVAELVVERGGHLLGAVGRMSREPGPVEGVVGVGPVAQLGVERRLERR